jgi:hypothetical protein
MPLARQPDLACERGGEGQSYRPTGALAGRGLRGRGLINVYIQRYYRGIQTASPSGWALCVSHHRRPRRAGNVFYHTKEKIGTLSEKVGLRKILFSAPRESGSEQDPAPSTIPTSRYDRHRRETQSAGRE